VYDSTSKLVDPSKAHASGREETSVGGVPSSPREAHLERPMLIGILSL
jgi:hypothetical protein